MHRAWWKESVVYHIYIKSFYDSNGDGIGDLNGITQKLDYLKYLGINAIWLSPIYESPNDDNGYDISDYRKIIREFGSMEDFDWLLKEAHDRQIKVILDIAVNHTSDEHAWFLDSKLSLDSKYRDFYIWRKGKNGEEPNNWGSYFGGSAWEYSSETDMYYLHLFSKKQPDLNWENNKVRDEIKNTLVWWLDKGIDGFRLDVINLISKDIRFPNGEIWSGDVYGDHSPYTSNGPRVHEYLRELNKEIFSKYDIMTVGETLDTTPEDALCYANLDGKELNMIFTFEHMELENVNGSKWNDNKFRLADLKRVLSKWQYKLNGKAWNSLYWSNHDQPRVVSRFGNDSQYWKESAKMLAVCLHMLQGTPYIYQGEEIGMTNIYFESIEEYQDIESKAAFYKYTDELNLDKETVMRGIRSKSRDNARSPMQWDDTENAGFSSGIPWFKVNPNYKTINAASQIEDPDSIYNFYRKIIALRKKYPIIVYGDYKLLDENNENIFSYIRRFGEEKLFVICNFSEQHQVVDMRRFDFSAKNCEVLICNYAKQGVIQLNDAMKLRPYEAVVLLQLN